MRFDVEFPDDLVASVCTEFGVDNDEFTAVLNRFEADDMVNPHVEQAFNKVFSLDVDSDVTAVLKAVAEYMILSSRRSEYQKEIGELSRLAKKAKSAEKLGFEPELAIAFQTYMQSMSSNSSRIVAEEQKLDAEIARLKEIRSQLRSKFNENWRVGSQFKKITSDLINSRKPAWLASYRTLTKTAKAKYNNNINDFMRSKLREELPAKQRAFLTEQSTRSVIMRFHDEYVGKNKESIKSAVEQYLLDNEVPFLGEEDIEAAFADAVETDSKESE